MQTQTPIHIEVESGRTVLLQELPSGDVEIVISTLVKPSFWQRTVSNFGGYYDKKVATIPKNRRCLLANWLIGNNHE